MGFYKGEGLDIKGGTVFLPDDAKSDSVVVNTDDAVWIWQASTGTYIKITIKDGVPVTEASIKKPSDPEKVNKTWADNL